MVEQLTQELYANALVEFQDACSDFPLFLNYVMTTLNEVNEKIVRAWIGHVLHLGCRTTNRVESAHALAKKYLDNSVGDLGTCLKKIHDMLVLQFTAIQSLRLFRLRGLLIICHASCFHLLKKWWML